MEMLLMTACLGLFALAVTCLAFGAATRFEPEAPAEDARPQPAALAEPARFFREGVAIPAAMPAQVSIEMLLFEIERHIRLEQAAAESFLESPTPDILHSRTMSTLVH